MDLKIILAWSAFILAAAGLIIFFRLRKKSRDRKTLEPLLEFARENNSEITNFDFWDKTLIGIDNNKMNCLFFIRSIPGYSIREKINLSEVSECRMQKTERKVKYNKGNVTLIDRIELIFTFHSNRTRLSLEFYNTDYDHQTLSGELLLAQKWTGVLKSIISEKNGRKAIKATRPILKTTA